MLAPRLLVVAEITAERLDAPRHARGRDDRRKGAGGAVSVGMAQGGGERAVAAHGVAEDRLPFGIDRKVFGDQGWQLFRHIAPHAVIRCEGRQCCIDVETGTKPEIVSVRGIAWHIFAARAIEVGARGYVSKTGDPHDLVEAIREVGKGGTYLPPAMARSIAFAGPAFARSPLSKLTSREMEILRLLGAGKSLSEIAWLVQSSYKTVANTSSIMRQKLGVRTSVELVRFAIEKGVA